MDEVWLRRTAALEPEAQLAEVLEEMRRRNPAFTGWSKPTIFADGKVSTLVLPANHVSNLGPLAALTDLRRLV